VVLQWCYSGVTPEEVALRHLGEVEFVQDLGVCVCVCVCVCSPHTGRSSDTDPLASVCTPHSSHPDAISVT
jgi:hypothetical protein